MSDAGSATLGTFFGLIVKPNKRYDTVVKEAFRVTKACIEPASAGDKVTSLYLEYDSEEFIIANLDKKTFNENLDLAFSLGEKISFKVEGPGTVHVTGNIIAEEDSDFEMFDDMESPEPNTGKRKNGEVKKNAKRMKLDSATSSNGKADDEDSSDDDSDDDSSDDESGEQTGAETTTLSDLDSTNNFAEEEDSEEEDSDSGEEEEEEDSDESDSSEEEAKEEKKPAKPAAKTNGDVSPSKKQKLESKTPVKEQKINDESKTPKSGKTPKPETPKAAKTPKGDDTKTPKTAKTPKPEENKTPKAAKTPKPEESKTPKAAKTPKGDAAVSTPKSVKKVMKGGVQIEDIKVGSGPEVKPGKPIGMYYSGRLQTNNKQFDACQNGKPFKFRLGAGEVIKGWDVGIVGMKVGGKRKLIIPPNMAYGSRGAPPDIPPNSTLIFDIECKFAH